MHFWHGDLASIVDCVGEVGAVSDHRHHAPPLLGPQPTFRSCLRMPHEEHRAA